MANLIVLNKIKATAHIVDCVAPADTYNGYLVKLGVQGTDKTYTVAAPGATTDKSLVMVLNVNLPYASDVEENNATISTGDIVRAYVLELGNVISIPTANITSAGGTAVTLEVGKYVIPVASAMKMQSINALGGTESVAFVIDELYTKAGVSMAKIRCIVAE